MLLFKRDIATRLIKKAQKAQKEEIRIVMPEAAYSENVIKAAQMVVKSKVAKIYLIGNSQKIKNTFLDANFNGVEFIDISKYKDKEDLVRHTYELKKGKTTLTKLNRMAKDPNCFAFLLLNKGIVDGVVTGSATKNSELLNNIESIMSLSDETEKLTSSVILAGAKMKNISDKGFAVFSDPIVNKKMDKATAKASLLNNINMAQDVLNIKPKITFVSHKTQENLSSKNNREIAELIDRYKFKDSNNLEKYYIQSNLQPDTIFEESVFRTKVKKGEWKGRSNIFILPNIESAHLTYKFLKATTGARVIGPMLQGLSRPISLVSRSTSVKEIFLTTAYTVLSASKGKSED